ncbi:MAG: hypothetical protein AAFR91_00680 [Pseudomonadota bacterium]
MRADAARLREHLALSNQLHETYLESPDRLAAYRRFVDLQVAYFLPKYDDLRSRPGYSEAIDYIISDMVGPTIAARDAELAKVVPMMSRILPSGALEALATALELNATILRINLDIEALLRDGIVGGAAISEREYCAASREAATLDDCLRLIAMTRRAGESLERIVRIPMIGSTLRMMRGPARLVGVTDLHEFLVRGYTIFRAIDDVHEFLDTVEARMTAVFTRVFEAPLDTLAVDNIQY